MITITFIPWDPDTDQAQVKHDGEVVWQGSIGHIDQYFKFYMPPGEPVLLQIDAH